VKKYLNLNVFVSLGIIVFACLWLRLANNMGYTGIGDTASVWGTAATVPKFLLIALIIMGIIIFISELLKARKSSPVKKDAEAKEKRKDSLYPIVMMVLILIYTLALDYLGFTICTALLTAGAMLLFGSRSKILLITVPVAFSLFLFLVFRYVLLINLPTFSLL